MLPKEAHGFEENEGVDPQVLAVLKARAKLAAIVEHHNELKKTLKDPDLFY